MAAHNLLNGLGGLIGLVEGNRGDEVVCNVGFDNAVEEMTSNETEFTVDGSSGTACKSMFRGGNEEAKGQCAGGK